MGVTMLSKTLLTAINTLTGASNHSGMPDADWKSLKPPLAQVHSANADIFFGRNDASKTHSITIDVSSANTSQEDANRFHIAMRPILLVAQCFAVLPVSGIQSSDASYLKFTWKSAKIIYHFTAVFGAAVLAIYSIVRIWVTGITATKTIVLKGSESTSLGVHTYVTFACPITANVFFFGAACITMLLFLRLARKWPDFVRDWEKLENEMISPPPPSTRMRLKTRLTLTAGVTMVLALASCWDPHFVYYPLCTEGPQVLASIYSLLHHLDEPPSDNPLEIRQALSSRVRVIIPACGGWRDRPPIRRIIAAHNDTRGVSFIAVALPLVEHLLSVVSGYASALECAFLWGDTDIMKTYFQSQFPQVFHTTSYNLGKGFLVQCVNILSTFSWNFMDLFLMLLSSALTERFRQMNDRLDSNRGKSMPDWWWAEAREDYNRLANLTRRVDSCVSEIVLLSFATNLYFICIQLLNSLKPKLDLPQAIYTNFSFGFLLARTAAVSLYAAAINDQSLLPSPILYSIPAESYSTEVQRFLMQTTTDRISLTGMNFFAVTRGLILTVAGTIVTYELVLVQFNAMQSVDSAIQNITNACDVK